MKNYKKNFGYFTPSYYSTPPKTPTFQGWIEPLNFYGKKSCQFLNQVGVTKVGISFKKK